MKALKSKTEERLEIENQIRFYLQQGGEIESVAPGISGREIGGYALPPVSFQQPREQRTLLVDEVKAIEARKHKPSKPTLPRRSKPRRVLITDDFGEPLRWSWEDK